MNCTIELVLGVVLLVLLYDKPRLLTTVANSVLGKIVILLAVGMVAKMKGLVTGLLAALVAIVLMHDLREGMENKESDKKEEKSDKKEEDDSESESEDDDNDSEDEDDKCENGECPVADKSPEVEASKKADIESFDVRLSEGFRNRESYQNTIEAMKFSNGHTGAGSNILNQF